MNRIPADVVADLRFKANRWPRWADTCDEAADLIERLASEVRVLREQVAYDGTGTYCGESAATKGTR